MQFLTERTFRAIGLSKGKLGGRYTWYDGLSRCNSCDWRRLYRESGYRCQSHLHHPSSPHEQEVPMAVPSSVRPNKKATPPGPAEQWRHSNSAAYNSDRIGFLVENAHLYGDVFRFSSRTIVLSDPDLIRDVFVRTNSDFHAEAPLFANRSDSQAFAAAIEDWMQSRHVAWRQMNHGLIERHGEDIVSGLDEALCTAGSAPIDVYDCMRRYTGAMITRFFVGAGTGDVAEAADRRSTLAVRFMASNLTLPKWLPHPGVRAAVKANSRL
ncbi:MAG TPA: cytochrome P450, partial [Candidatus Nanopelagicaceae bacterium]|nr:cytochrome P450 [Candidatus Nanopelagicaceae bacterium]